MRSFGPADGEAELVDGGDDDAGDGVVGVRARSVLVALDEGRGADARGVRVDGGEDFVEVKAGHRDGVLVNPTGGDPADEARGGVARVGGIGVAQRVGELKQDGDAPGGFAGIGAAEGGENLIVGEERGEEVEFGGGPAVIEQALPDDGFGASADGDGHHLGDQHGVALDGGAKTQENAEGSGGVGRSVVLQVNERLQRGGPGEGVQGPYLGQNDSPGISPVVVVAEVGALGGGRGELGEDGGEAGEIGVEGLLIALHGQGVHLGAQDAQIGGAVFKGTGPAGVREIGG